LPGAAAGLLRGGVLKDESRRKETITAYRYEAELRAPHASWHGRVVFNLYDESGYWIARVGGDTREQAIVEARRHAVVRQMESSLRAISVNPEAAIALQDHPAWKTRTEALRFIDEPQS
jgi:hypothetical protein